MSRWSTSKRDGIQRPKWEGNNNNTNKNKDNKDNDNDGEDVCTSYNLDEHHHYNIPRTESNAAFSLRTASSVSSGWDFWAVGTAKSSGARVFHARSIKVWKRKERDERRKGMRRGKGCRVYRSIK